MAKYPDCPIGCVSYCKLPEDSYYLGCGPRVEARRKLGLPISGYKKVGGPSVWRNRAISGGGIIMLLKARGWHGGQWIPVIGCPCVRQVGRDFAIRAAEKYALWKGIKQMKKAA